MSRLIYWTDRSTCVLFGDGAGAVVLKADSEAGIMSTHLHADGGKKVPVVYDSVGKDTFMKSLDCLAPLGVAALFGQSSGNVDPLNLGLLAQKGSLYVTRPTLFTYAAKRENLVAMAKELFDVVKSGVVKIEVNQTYPLKEAAKAHADLAARKTTGSTVLTI